MAPDQPGGHRRSTKTSTPPQDNITDLVDADPTELTRARLVSAALSCFDTFGIQKTTIDDIAERSGASRGTFYRYFRSKTDILEAVTRKGSEQFYRDMATRMSAQSSFDEQLCEAAVFVREFHVVNRTGVGDSTAPDAYAVLYTNHAERLLADCVEFLMPYVKIAQGIGQVRRELDPARTSEWCARILFSLHATPSVTVDLNDPREVRRFVKEHIRGLIPDR
jgi:AcrR family transcriptional regulator